MSAGARLFAHILKARAAIPIINYDPYKDLIMNTIQISFLRLLWIYATSIDLMII
jgi:hypothetical protein